MILRYFFGARAPLLWVGTAMLIVLVGAAKAGGTQTVGKDNDRHEDKTVVIVAGGDLGFGGNHQPISAKGGYRHGRLIRWAEIGKAIEPLLDGDINFANLETVVTGHARLVPAEKKFRFQMHAEGARRIVKMGFNVLSTANNHSRDYGQAGMRETLMHLSALKSSGLLAFPGVGRGRASALRPHVFKTRGAYTIAISAIGIGGVALTEKSTGYGQIGYHNVKDFNKAVDTLAGSKADYQILSVHYGTELSIRPSAHSVVKLRDRAVRQTGIDLVLGHHAHVAAGVQNVNGKLIFYGLGNLLHFGMQNMAKFNVCRNFGLMVRVFLSPGKKGRLAARAVQVIPLTEMHEHARPMADFAAHKRIAVLNGLAAGLNDAKTGAVGLQFAPLPDGTGLYCFNGADREGGRIAKICRDWPDEPQDRPGMFPVYHCGPARRARPARVAMDYEPRQKSKRTGTRSNFVNDYYAETYEH